MPLQREISAAVTEVNSDALAWTAPRIGAARIVKRLLDIGVSSALLILLSPLMAVLALVIKCQDGGPVFYRRRVLGSKGEFDAFKLRSMREGADEFLRLNPLLLREFVANFKLKDDPRITRAGAILRKTSLDE